MQRSRITAAGSSAPALAMSVLSGGLIAAPPSGVCLS
jgi:hypothetical protein